MFLPSQTQRRTSSTDASKQRKLLGDTLGTMTEQVSLVVPRGEKDVSGFTVKQGPSPEARQMAKLIGERVVGDAIDAMTDHAWLVVLGHFAQALGLVAGLQALPIDQRQGPKCGPQTKLIEFLVGILGGIEHLQDLNLSEHPLVQDPSVAQAWAQELFVHYSGVSRTLDAADEETLAAVVEVLQAISRPFIDAAVVETLRQAGCLVIDVDLTGREVSPTSTDYPEADFGWMEDGVHKGYQAAVTSLVCQRWQRLMLTLQRYAGRTHSAQCLQAAVEAVEALLGVRPRRRVELLEQRCRELAADMATLHKGLECIREAEGMLWRQIHTAKSEQIELQGAVATLEAEYLAQGRREKAHCRLAKTRRQLAGVQKREKRLWCNLAQRQQQRDTQQRAAERLQNEILSLDERLSHLQADNQANPNPVSIVLRIDAGFSTGANLSWLIEMGYLVRTKAHHGSTADSLRRRLTPETAWTRVGSNAHAVQMGCYQQNDCPYPLQAMLLRYHLPGQTRYTALLAYDESPPPPLPEWFAQYNGRQTIEAGIKEEKGVFTLKRHLVRSRIGMQLQEQFALFGANFVRWAAAWVKDMLNQTNRNFVAALSEVKTLVRIVSHARARWVRNELGHTLILSECGPFAGTVISLSGLVAVQLALDLFKFGVP
jgi:hypothetical protein